MIADDGDDGIRRVRDPVYGLLVFDTAHNEDDSLAWELMDTAEFQRLRRIKQLGVSEFTFPGATHNRFAHSMGVYWNARKLMGIARAYLKEKLEWDGHRARIAMAAALLHDLGHGPFSHAFEQAEKVRLGTKYEDHEKWTAKIIRSPETSVHKTLVKRLGNSAPDEVASMLLKPEDIYAAVFSSSFDADRMDYLVRDRLMTGSGAGSIDVDWLVDNLRIAQATLFEDEGDDLFNGSSEISYLSVFCFEEKALQAAEMFILARYHLYSQVYFHKTTRGIEQLLSTFLIRMSTMIGKGLGADTGVSASSPLYRFYKDKKMKVSSYIELDDTAVWQAIQMATRSSDAELSDLATRLWTRKRAKCLEVATENPTEVDISRRRSIEKRRAGSVGRILVDRAPLSVYSVSDREREAPHKRVRIRRASDGVPVDVTKLSKTVQALTDKQELLRYYFLDESDFDAVLEGEDR